VRQALNSGHGPALIKNKSVNPFGCQLDAAELKRKEIFLLKGRNLTVKKEEIFLPKMLAAKGISQM
jgi:hypothetical protein